MNTPCHEQHGRIRAFEDMVRAELERRASSGELVEYHMAEDRGLSIEEYVELIVSVTAAISEDAP